MQLTQELKYKGPDEPGRRVSPPEIKTTEAEFSTNRLSSTTFGCSSASLPIVIAYGTPLKWESSTVMEPVPWFRPPENSLQSSAT